MTGLGDVFRDLREGASLSQREFADQLGVDQSRVSRIEGGTVTASEDECERWLDASRPEDAERARVWMGGAWDARVGETPKWNHPDLVDLAHIAEIVQVLNQDCPDSLRASVERYRDELIGLYRSLLSLDYRAALVGAPAVGKSTAETLGLDLLTPSGEWILPTGGGHTTLCEGLIQQGDRWGIIIEPEAPDEIRRLIEDLCVSLQPFDDRPAEERPKVPSEVRTALLNLAGVAPPKTELGPDGESLRRDPLRDLALEEGDRLISSLLISLRLGERQRTEVWWEPAVSVEPLAWLRENLRKINKGLHPEVTLPRRLRLVLARPIVPEGPFSVTFVDTRGVTDDVVRRPDFARSLADQRTVVVLCSSFLNAPDLYVRQLIRYAEEQEFTGWRSRLVVLLLARQQEPPQVCYENTGEPVDTPEDGIRIKEAHTRRELCELGPSEGIIATYDALNDAPSRFRLLVLQRIVALRADEKRRISAIEAASKGMIESAKHHEALVARQAVRREVLSLLGELQDLQRGSGHPQDLVLRETANAHHRSVWAMTRRRGQWHKLSLDLHLSDGATLVAREWSRDSITKLTEVFDLLEKRADLKTAQGLLQQLREAVEQARTDFIAQCRLAAEATIWGPMHADLRLWADCEGEWRQGGGFKRRVLAHLNRWFLHNENTKYVEDFCNRLQAIWQVRFIEQVRRLCGSSDANTGFEAA